jgi:uncharacterized protein (DUF3820 family)
MKIDINLYTTKYGIRCFINSIDQIDNDTLKKLSDIVSSREGGYFRYDLAEFGMRKRYTKEYLLKIFSSYGIETEIIEPTNIEDKMLKLVSNMRTIYSDHRHEEIVGFGKYKGRIWEDIPEHYLYWLIDTYSDTKAELAYHELKRRGIEFFEEVPIEDKIVEFGKYKGFTYKDVPQDYLVWLIRNYDDKKSQLASAELKRRELLPKESIVKNSEIDRIRIESISFGKYSGTKWCDIDSSYLEWLVNNFNNPDVVKLAKLTLESRSGK